VEHHRSLHVTAVLSYRGRLHTPCIQLTFFVKASTEKFSVYSLVFRFQASKHNRPLFHKHRTVLRH